MYESEILVLPKAKLSYKKKFITIGECYISNEPTHIWTVLGSCVSVIMHSHRKKISAICHAQLAEHKYMDVFNKQLNTDSSKLDFRYMACSIIYMYEQLIKRGVQNNDIEVSVYGGGSIISQFTQNIGEDNLLMAEKTLDFLGLYVCKKDIGGQKSRTIRHYSDTGVTHSNFI